MRAGANGYVPKMIVPEELVKAVRAVGTGRRYITPLVAELLASECAADEEGPLHNRLSERELQVFTRIAAGAKPADAVAAPRHLFGRTWGHTSATLKLEAGYDDATASALARAGHDIEWRS